MTSEEPQKQEWPPAEEGSSGGSAFGLFEAPSAPDDFPIFAPYSSDQSSSDGGSADSGTSYQSSFGGFPDDSDPYVPAPAVVEIPGVKHESAPSSSYESTYDSWSSEFSSGSSSSSSSSDSSPWESSSSSETSPWASAGSASSYSSSSSTELDGPGYSSSSSSSSTSYDEPSWSDSSSSSSYSSSSYSSPSSSSSSTSSSSGAMMPNEPSGSWAAFAAGETPKPSTGPLPSQSSSAWSSSADALAAEQFPSFGSETPVPPAPPAPPVEPPPAPATGSVRVAASVPSSSLAAPSDAPPQMPKPAGRVYGSASVPAPGEPPAAAAPAAESAPVAPMIPTQPAKATARASVRVSPPEPMGAPGMPVAPPQAAPAVPGTGPVVMSRSSTVYGAPRPADADAGVQAPPAQRQPGRQPNFGDLISGAPGGAPAQAQVAPPMGTAQVGMPMQAPMGHAPMGAPPQAPHAMVPIQRGPQPPVLPPDQIGLGEPPAPDPKPEGGSGRVILGVVVGALALLAVAFGLLIAVGKIMNNPSLDVGDCVRQSSSNNEATEKVDCSDPEAYKIVSSVDAISQCPPPQTPHIQLGDEVLCLTLANPPSDSQTDPSAAPSATP